MGRHSLGGLSRGLNLIYAMSMQGACRGENDE